MNIAATMNHFQLIVIKRIADHAAAEQKRLDAEREKIRQEEQAKAEREARAKLTADIERERIAVETKAAAQPPVAPCQSSPGLSASSDSPNAVSHQHCAGILGEMDSGNTVAAAAPSIAAARDAGDVADISPAVVTAKDQPAATLPAWPGLIRSFMLTQKGLSTIGKEKLVNKLNEFCSFCDTFKVK